MLLGPIHIPASQLCNRLGIGYEAVPGHGGSACVTAGRDAGFLWESCPVKFSTGVYDGAFLLEESLHSGC